HTACAALRRAVVDRAADDARIGIDRQARGQAADAVRQLVTRIDVSEGARYVYAGYRLRILARLVLYRAVAAVFHGRCVVLTGDRDRQRCSGQAAFTVGNLVRHAVRQAATFL